MICVLFLDFVRFALQWQSSQICPGVDANEIQIPYDKYHKVSLMVKVTKTHTIGHFAVVYLVTWP